MTKQQGTIFRDNQEKIPTERVEQLPDRAIQRSPSEHLSHLARQSSRVLLDIKAVFPFNFFPDEVILDEAKVSIHTNFFFYSKEVRSVEYKDIFNVLVQQSLFFAKLAIIDRYFTQQPIVVQFLRKNDAFRARRLIQGMIIVKKENIDIRELSREELLQKLDRIGQSR